MQDYEISHAECGEAGITLAEQSAPDLVLLDLLLPDISGIEVCRLLSQKLLSVSVIIISYMQDLEDKKAAFKAGAVDYITKPLDSAEVVLRVRTHLDLVQTRKELQSQLDLVQGILDNMPQGLLLIEENLQCRLVNNWLSRQSGQQFNQTRISLYSLFHDDEVQKIADALMLKGSTKSKDSLLLTMTAVDGKKLQISAVFKKLDLVNHQATLAFLSMPEAIGEMKELEDYISGKMQDIMYRAGEIMHRFNPEQPVKPPAEIEIPSDYNLADLEKEIVQAILEGLPNKEIAFLLNRSDAYIRKKISAIYRKTGVHSRYELMRLLG